MPRQTFTQDEGRYEMSYQGCEMRNLQSIPSAGSMHAWSLAVQIVPDPQRLPALHMGLYNKVVTYFFLYRWVALSTITPSLIESA